MGVHCGKCGKRLGSRAELPGHYRRAHGQAHRGTRQRRSGRVQGKVLDVTPIRSEIVPARFKSAPAMFVLDGIAFTDAELVGRFGLRKPIRAEIVDVAPARSEITSIVPVRLQKKHIDYGESWIVKDARLINGERQAFTIRTQATDATILKSQYYALKALATRLDTGIGTERERVAFGAGLREYNANFDRIARRKALLER